MLVTRVEVQDVRSYDRASLDLTGGATVLVGANAQGKTNLLEALVRAATGSSHRVAGDGPMVRAGADVGVVRVDLQTDEGRRRSLELEVGTGRRTRTRVDGQDVRRSVDALGVLRVVLFAPEDLAVVRGQPDDRRRLLDDLLAQRRPAYAATKSEYDRVLRQRNQLLKQARSLSGSAREAALATLDTWTDQLVGHGAGLLAARIAVVHALSGVVDATYRHIADRAEPIGLTYRSSTGRAIVGDSALGVPDREELAGELAAAQRAVADDEQARGVTLVGPHRDDLDLTIGALPARTHASQGEAWSLALALRLATYDVLAEVGDRPVVLLDDVFSELDQRRRGRLAEACRDWEQVLVTAAVPEDVPVRGRYVDVALRDGATVLSPRPAAVPGEAGDVDEVGSGMNRPEDDRRTSWGTDRNPTVYARRRAQAARRRADLDRQSFDPAPPTEDDWVVRDRSQVTRVARAPELVGDVLDDIVRDRRWGERLRGTQVFDRWEQVVGADLARHCRPVRLAGGVLTVAASSPRWATQLRYLTGQLALNVNAELGEPVVESVNVVVDRGDQGLTVPELPDIEDYLAALRHRAQGQVLERLRITSFTLLKTYDPPVSAVEGRVLTGLRRLGKRIVFEFADDEAERGGEGGDESLYVERGSEPLYLVIHLMIAGRLRWREKRASVPKRNGLAALDLPTGTVVLTEAGTKKRASMHLHRGEDALLEAHDRGGVEPLDADLATFAEALTRENRTLKRALTDQRLFSGIGNAFSDEILHAAGLSPVQLTSRLDDDEIGRLHAATVDTLRSWVDRLRSQTGDGFPEKVTAFRDDFAVHGRYEQPCPVCETPVQRIRYADNETNYCPRCQTGGKVLADRSLSRLLKDDWPRTVEELED